MKLPSGGDHIYKVYESSDGQVLVESVDSHLMRRNLNLPRTRRATTFFVRVNGEIRSSLRVGGLLPSYERRVVRAASKMVEFAKEIAENEET